MTSLWDIRDEHVEHAVLLFALTQENRERFQHEFKVKRGTLLNVSDWCQENLPKDDFTRLLYTIWVRSDEQAVLLRLAHGEHVTRVDPDRAW